MEYSPVKQMRVQNFRNIGDITVSFTESPIIALVGDNEAGKTSVIKAFSVAGLNSMPKKQVRLIRDGTTGFYIMIELEDGTKVERLKSSSTNALRIKRGEEVWQTNKFEGGPIPKLHDVIGIVEEPETKELLQLRSYEDPLLFVVTSDSTNYKVMYNALKVDQLTRAVRLGTSEVNELRREISNAEYIINEYNSQIKKIRLVDVEPVTNIKARLLRQLQVLDKLNAAMQEAQNIATLQSKLQYLAILRESGIGEIDVSLAEKLNKSQYIAGNITQTEHRLEQFIGLDKAVEIDIVFATKLKQVIDYWSITQKLDKTLGSLKDLSQLSEIKADYIPEFERALQLAVSVEHLISEEKKFSELSEASEIADSSILSVDKLLSAITNTHNIEELQELLEKQNQRKNELNKLIKDSGAIVTTCTSCGEDVVVDISQLEEYHI